MPNFAAAVLPNDIEPPCHNPNRWFVVYTSPNHEKRVAEQFRVRCIESYLPLYRRTGFVQWHEHILSILRPSFSREYCHLPGAALGKVNVSPFASPTPTCH